MRRAALHPGVAAFAALILAACATRTPPPQVQPEPAPTAPAEPAPERPDPRPLVYVLSDLPGWAAEDHLAAFEAVKTGCQARRDPSLTALCHKANRAGRLNAAEAKAWLEAHLVARSLGGEGVLTAYFAPQYEARFSRRGDFTAPVRAKPADLEMIDLGAGVVPAQVVGGKARPYPDRAAIETIETDKPLAWMKPEDLFFMQIQGSGVLTLPDGKRFKALYAAHNGHPFLGVAAPMREQGLLADSNTSAENIRAWLAEHRGPQADAVMQLNRRYVFFHLKPDDGAEPRGAANIPLPPGRAIAVDPSQHSYGGLYWIDADTPKLNGAFPTYRRLVAALDTGGAIKGPVRADLYMGTGAAAGLEAGRVRHSLRLYRLVPRD
ncbi:MltA domain-containing protein [Caulobacter sp. NIBR2454]|uniref:MltA domain-containing protein n=1 Tax=Caulobacter sp. NIBR2454 TaxID=3015996 RepID=UPI0022B66A32|nr:MltA domain-containing protein [Caulobacter sp. NIBR2454]